MGFRHKDVIESLDTNEIEIVSFTTEIQYCLRFKKTDFVSGGLQEQNDISFKDIGDHLYLIVGRKLWPLIFYEYLKSTAGS